MTTKFLALISVIGLVSVCLVQGQLLVPGGSPDESPSPTKHRAHKKAEATASPAEEAASPSPAESPAASPSPGKRRAQKKAEATAAASPAAAESTAAASASPAEKRSKFTLRDLFKPKTSASAAPAAASQAPASPAPAKPAVTEPATNAPAQGGGHGLVWVNTELHVYHREGSRFYGTSKKGKYVTEADAIKEGDRAAGKGQ
jgi:pyruvate/2-oxoglutarate dehydrogenase complex dihydrolipoamide acyltransferase (E2) component